MPNADPSKVTYLPPAPRGASPAPRPGARRDDGQNTPPFFTWVKPQYLVFGVVGIIVVAEIMDSDAPQIVRVSGAVLSAFILYLLSRVNWRRYVLNTPARLRAASTKGGVALLSGTVLLAVAVLLVWWGMHINSVLGLLVALTGGSLGVAALFMTVGFGFGAFMTLLFSPGEPPNPVEIVKNQNADTDAGPATEDELHYALRDRRGGKVAEDEETFED